MKLSINKFCDIVEFIKNNKFVFVAFFIVFVCYLINTLHTNFPDEYDNIVGGYYITHGILPYRGFFSHHGPVAYFFAAPITLFTKQSFVNFRIILSLVYFCILLSTYFLLKKLLKIKFFYEFLFFCLILSVTTVYFWGHMLLADTLSGYLLIPAYVLVLLKVSQDSKLTLLDLALVSILSTLTFFTTITYTYVAIIFNLFVLYVFYTQNKIKIFSRKTLKISLIFIIPCLFFLGYFVISGSLLNYYEQGILYNKNIYIYNYPRPQGSTTLNPLRYAIVIIHEFFVNYRALLTQVKDFNFSYPFNITLAIANLSLLIYLVVQKKYRLFFFVLSILIFTNPRSNPLTSKETDFQSSVYIMFSLFNISYILFLLKSHLVNHLNLFKKIIFIPLFLITSLYFFFFTLFIFDNFFEKAYQKYMGTAPLIYDRPQVAPIINKLITRNDYFWIGPHEFEELLYINGKLPSKYHWFLRAHSETPKIKKELISDLQKNKPKIIVYKRDYSSFGQNPQSLNSLMINFLDKDYFQIGNIGSPSGEYRAKQKTYQNFDLEEHFYFDLARKEEIVKQLLELNVIEKK